MVCTVVIKLLTTQSIVHYFTQANMELVRKAKSIVIVGGGAVGVELAAEIVETFAGKTVQIVHGEHRLFHTKWASLSSWVKKWLTDNHVEVGYNLNISQQRVYESLVPS